MAEHLEKNNLIHNTQHGFRKNKSTLTNLLEFFDNVVNAIDRKEIVDIIYLDFAKAFDKVPHSKLILKLRSYYIDENLITKLD